MKFMGSKNRIAKHIIPIMLEDSDNVEYFYDVCCGGGNLIDKIPNRFKRIAIDIDKNVIEAMKIIQNRVDKLPKNNKEFTEYDYRNLRHNDHWLRSYAGYAYSYAGKWFGGWCRDSKGKRDYVSEAYRNALKQHDKIQDVEFICASYDEIIFRRNSIIYCDIPYQNTTKYKNEFNYNDFWYWVRYMSEDGFRVYVSEYNAPDDFKVIWEKEIVSSLEKNTGNKKGIEKLFVYGEK
jgi:DNA adenine methylase